MPPEPGQEPAMVQAEQEESQAAQKKAQFELLLFAPPESAQEEPALPVLLPEAAKSAAELRSKAAMAFHPQKFYGLQILFVLPECLC